MKKVDRRLAYNTNMLKRVDAEIMQDMDTLRV